MNLFRFTERQLFVARLIDRGFTNAEIAKQLRVSESTVKQDIRDIRVATGATKKRLIPGILRDLGYLQ